MRGVWSLVKVAVMVVAWATGVVAADATKSPAVNLGPWRARLERSGPAALVAVVAVQEELKLTSGQNGKLLWPESLGERRRSREPGASESEGMVGAPGDDGRRRRENTIAATELLSAAQIRRLWEITLQIEGAWALTWPEVQEGLDLQPDQSAQIEAIRAEERAFKASGDEAKRARFEAFVASRPRPPGAEEIRDWHRQMRPRFDAQQADRAKVRARSIRRISQILTRRQRDQFTRRSGKPFDLSTLKETPAPAPGG